jgi:hypothetical protein
MELAGCQRVGLFVVKEEVPEWKFTMLLLVMNISSGEYINQRVYNWVYGSLKPELCRLR